jgi:anti-anti-sigma factor
MILSKKKNGMEIIEVCWGSALVLEFKGRLDTSTSNIAQEKLETLIQKGYTRLALDLSKLEYISSVGLRVLLTILKKAKSYNGKIALFGFKDYIKKIFDIAGFNALFAMYPTAEDALSAFHWSHPLARFVRAPRRGPNNGAYCGETINIDALLEEVIQAAKEHGWACEPILDEEGCGLFGFSRMSPTATKSAYISSGMHGDEPAPPLAVLDLLWRNEWPAEWNIYLCPCLNPSGFGANKRENAEGIDLNRDYYESVSKEIQAHVAWLEKQPPFSVAMSLHEDWEAEGFYFYQLGPLSVEPVIHHLLGELAQVCTIDESSMIDRLPAEEGVLDLAFHSLQMNEAVIDGLGDPSLDASDLPRLRSIWSEPIFLINRKTRVSYTFESASAFPLELRVQALTRAVDALLSCPHEIY